MKKEELTLLLNKEPDSISLHDSSVYRFEMINNSVKFTIALGGYHYLVNNLEEYVDSLENTVVVTLQFCGLEDVECAFYDEFRLNRCDIMDNFTENNGFVLELDDCGSVGKMKFKYKRYVWDVVGEFNKEQLSIWEKENGFCEDCDEDD